MGKLSLAFLVFIFVLFVVTQESRGFRFRGFKRRIRLPKIRLRRFGKRIKSSIGHGFRKLTRWVGSKVRKLPKLIKGAFKSGKLIKSLLKRLTKSITGSKGRNPCSKSLPNGIYMLKRIKDEAKPVYDLLMTSMTEELESEYGPEIAYKIRNALDYMISNDEGTFINADLEDEYDMIVQAVQDGMEEMSGESENDSQEEEEGHQLMDLELEQQENEQGLNRDNSDDSFYELGLEDPRKNTVPIHQKA